MNVKYIKLRNFLLSRIERGDFPLGSRLPGARILAKQGGACFPQMQMVIEHLSQCGILEIRARSGSYVKDNYNERLVPGILYLGSDLSFVKEIIPILERELPEIYVAQKFKCGIFELRATHYLISHQDEYIDLSPLFNKRFPKKRNFRMEFLNDYIINGKLLGIPVYASPWMLAYNKEMFHQADVAFPEQNWNWRDFQKIRCRLEEYHGAGSGIFMAPTINYLMNFVASTGGTLITKDGDVKIDTPENIAAFKVLADMLHLHCRSEFSAQQLFREGKIAMHLTTRQDFSEIEKDLAFEAGISAFPAASNSKERHAVLSGMFLCIRKNCADMALAEKIIRFFVSPNVQNFIGDNSYGIPFLKTAPFSQSEINRIWLAELPRVCGGYNIFNPVDYDVIVRSLRAILLSTPETIHNKCVALAEVFRMIHMER